MITCYFTTNYLLFVRDGLGFGYLLADTKHFRKEDFEDYDSRPRFTKGITPWHEFAKSDGILEQFEISNPSDLATTHPEYFI